MKSAILRIAVHTATKEASFVQYFSGRILLSFAISQPRRFWGMGPEEFKTNEIERPLQALENILHGPAALNKHNKARLSSYSLHIKPSLRHRHFILSSPRYNIYAFLPCCLFLVEVTAVTLRAHCLTSTIAMERAGSLSSIYDYFKLKIEVSRRAEDQHILFHKYLY
jgi:hypothetical protein